MAKLTREQRFWAKVDRTGDCWVWTAHRDSKGYGRFNWWPEVTRAHQAAYRLAGLAVPDGLVLDHTCGNRACVRVSHLEPVTSGENTRRGRSANREKTHCAYGHPFDARNTRYYDGGTRRACRTCDRTRPARGAWKL